MWRTSFPNRNEGGSLRASPETRERRPFEAATNRSVDRVRAARLAGIDGRVGVGGSHAAREGVRRGGDGRAEEPGHVRQKERGAKALDAAGPAARRREGRGAGLRVAEERQRARGAAEDLRDDVNARWRLLSFFSRKGFVRRAGAARPSTRTRGGR